MRKFLLRLMVVVFAVILQASFVLPLFPLDFTPNIILSLALAWVILLDFGAIWIWISIVGLFFDFFSSAAVGKGGIFLILTTYLVGFLARRFLTSGSRSWRNIAIISFVILSTVTYDFFIFFWDWIGGADTNSYLANSGLPFYLKSVTVRSFLNVLFFSLSYFFLEKLEKNISFYENSRKIK